MCNSYIAVKDICRYTTETKLEEWFVLTLCIQNSAFSGGNEGIFTTQCKVMYSVSSLMLVPCYEPGLLPLSKSSTFTLVLLSLYELLDIYR